MKISRIIVDPIDMGLFINNFWVALTLLQDKEQVQIFLKDILTHTEMKMFAKRLQIAKMLSEGYNYLVIKNYVKVTDQTIARINNILNSDNHGYKKAIELLRKYDEETQRKIKDRCNPFKIKNYPGRHLTEGIGEIVIDEYKKYKRRKSI